MKILKKLDVKTLELAMQIRVGQVTLNKGIFLGLELLVDKT